MCAHPKQVSQSREPKLLHGRIGARTWRADPHGENSSKMKRIWLVILAALLVAPFTFAQGNHVEVGAFGDYFRLGNANNTNFWAWAVARRSTYINASNSRRKARMTFRRASCSSPHSTAL